MSVNPDACLGNSDYSSFYHYYSFSPCIFDSTAKILSTAKSCDDVTTCTSNKLTYSSSYLTTKNKGLTPVGIAKDGHVIYGPYNALGSLW